MAIKTNRKSGSYLGLALWVALSSHTPVNAESIGKDVFDSQCESCHQLSEKTPDTLKKLWELK